MTAKRRCWTCREEKALDSFVLAERVCVVCKEAGKTREFSRACGICATPFVAASPVAKYCGKPCERVGRAETARALRRRKKLAKWREHE